MSQIQIIQPKGKLRKIFEIGVKSISKVPGKPIKEIPSRKIKFATALPRKKNVDRIKKIPAISFLKYPGYMTFIKKLVL